MSLWLVSEWECRKKTAIIIDSNHFKFECYAFCALHSYSFPLKNLIALALTVIFPIYFVCVCVSQNRWYMICPSLAHCILQNKFHLCLSIACQQKSVVVMFLCAVCILGSRRIMFTNSFGLIFAMPFYNPIGLGRRQCIVLKTFHFYVPPAPIKRVTYMCINKCICFYICIYIYIPMNKWILYVWHCAL